MTTKIEIEDQRFRITLSPETPLEKGVLQSMPKGYQTKTSCYSSDGCETIAIDVWAEGSQQMAKEENKK